MARSPWSFGARNSAQTDQPSGFQSRCESLLPTQQSPAGDGWSVHGIDRTKYPNEVGVWDMQIARVGDFGRMTRLPASKSLESHSHTHTFTPQLPSSEYHL